MNTMLEGIQFPLYRKYKNEKHFFKINSPDEFEEIQLIGNRTIHTKHTAKILPDRNFIYDLCLDTQLTLESNETEFNSKR